MPSKDSSSEFSEEIRHKLSLLLGNPSYFKLEGFTVLPHNGMIFGIREIGEDFVDFSYVIKIVFVTYTEDRKRERIFLNDDFKLIYNFTPKENLKQFDKLGLSSLEWDGFNKRILLITSYENGDEDLGAYLWKLSLEDLFHNKPPTLFVDESGNVFDFNHKAEGIAVIDSKRAIVIHDDDKDLNFEKEKRKPNEAFYSLIDY